MYRKEKKIPTILAFFLLFAVIGSIVIFNPASHQIDSKANPSVRPEDIHFTNVSDNSFTISWFTSSSTFGTVIMNDAGPASPAGRQSLLYLDDLDSDNVSRPRTTHFITVKNLKENSSYSVKVISGQSNCSSDENCPKFEQKTINHLTTASTLPAARGSIIAEDGKPQDNAIIYLTVGKSSFLAGKTDSSGLWVIPFNFLRTGDLLSRPNLADNDLVQIIAKISPDKKAEAVIDVKSIRQNLIIPPLQIGKSYNLIDLISKKDLLASLTSSNTLGVQTQTGNLNNISSTSTSKSIDILFPAFDDDTTTDNQPRFRGIGIAGKQLVLIVNSTSPQTARVTVGTDSTWSWRPSLPLEPGIHHLGLSGYDKDGSYISLTRRFIVLKSGEQVLGEATSSATLTPTTQPSPIITLIPVPSPTSTITLIPIASPTSIISPSIPIVSPSATPIIPPKTGSTNITLLILGGGASLLLAGLKFLLFP